MCSQNDADLAATRGLGQRRLRSGLAVGALVVIVGVGFVLVQEDDSPHETAGNPTTVSGESTSSSSSSSTPTTGSSTTVPWEPPEDDPTAPSPAAVAADRSQWDRPVGMLDCGVNVQTAGYPTTTVGRPDALDCILDAIETRTPAQRVVTGRNFENGMEGEIFRVELDGTLTSTPYAVDVNGAISEVTNTCLEIRRLGQLGDLVCVDPSLIPTPESDPSEPTAEAVAAKDAIAIVPPNYTDCGVRNHTVGWPTTFSPQPSSANCIIDAAADGLQAQYTVWGRDFVGGISGVRFRVDGPGQIDRYEFFISPEGNTGSTGRTCTTLTASESEFPDCT